MMMLVALSFLVPDPSMWQSGAPSAQRVRPGLDPAQVVCRREREPGTRLVIRRTCMTRQEWAAYNRELRQNVDRAQMTRVHVTH